MDVPPGRENESSWRVCWADYLPADARAASAEMTSALAAGRRARKITTHTPPQSRSFASQTAAELFASSLRREQPDVAVRAISVVSTSPRRSARQLGLADDWPVERRPDS